MSVIWYDPIPIIPSNKSRVIVHMMWMVTEAGEVDVDVDAVDVNWIHESLEWVL